VPSPPKSDKPVAVRAHRLALQNSKWRIFQDDITGADGSKVDGYITVVPHVERADRVGGVTVLPVMADGRVGLLWNYRHPLELFAAARRELAEETGLVCAPNRLIPIGTLAQEASTLAVKGALFLALDCHMAGKPDRSEPGLGELKLHTLDEALALADRGEIQDSATLIALYRYALGRFTKP
jgi:8-oxo-dGDP phosphatase